MHHVQPCLVLSTGEVPSRLPGGGEHRHTHRTMSSCTWGGLGALQGGVLHLLPRVLSESREQSTKLEPPFPPALRGKAGVFVLLPGIYDLGEDTKHKPDEGAARGCLGAGGGPGACGWVTLYNYNTAAEAPEPGVAAGGGCRLPICSASFGSEWISSVWVGAYCCVCFSSPSRLFSLPGLSARSEQQGSQRGEGEL